MRWIRLLLGTARARRAPLFRAVVFCSTVLVAVAASGTTFVPTAAASAPTASSCEQLASLSLPDTTIVSAVEITSGTFSRPGVGTFTGLPAFCDVQLTVTNPPANDQVNVEVWLPTNTWNGRFQGTGGGGYVGGFVSALVPALKAGYATAETDTGHVSNGFAGALDGSWALNSSGQLNWQLIIDNAYLGIHEMTVAAKAVTAAYYGVQPAYAYFNGCSTGGRQGLMEAQRYPTDYNGILSGAPAINWTQFIPAEFWPELVMLQANDFLPQCKFAAFDAAAVSACDALDGVTDGVIGDLADCHFDPASLIGSSTPCGTITATDAAVVARIWQGARSTSGSFLWYGLEPGASFSGLANTVTANGQTVGAPFPIATDWIKYFLLQNPSWDWHTATFAQFDQWFQQSVAEFSTVIATNNPNLSPFNAAGGKIIIWHGLADQLIFPDGTINYYQRVQKALGGEQKTDQFARLFLAPGVAHCGGGVGPAPSDPFAALVMWVEHHQAPRALLASRTDANGNVIETRPLCMYPLVARYMGHGSTDDAANFTCQKGFGPSTGN